MGVFTTAARTWSVGETVTAANLNAQLRDLVAGFGTWTAYTPTWTSSGTQPGLGNGSLSGAYLQIGKLVVFRFKLVGGSSVAWGSGAYSFGLPVALNAAYASNDIVQGLGHVFSSAGHTVGFPLVSSSTAVSLLTTTANTTVAQTVPGTLSATSTISISGTYEAA